MPRIVLVLGAVIALLLTVPVVLAQPATVLGGAVFARTSDGQLFMIQDATRIPVTIVPWDDERILSIPLAEPEAWVTTARFGSNDDATTPPFTVGKRWRIAYTVAPMKSGPGQICVNAEALDERATEPSFGCYTQNGEAYAYAPGTFYLDISAVGEGWTIQVQELR